MSVLMYQICRVCQHAQSRYIFQSQLLNHVVKYYECPICEFVQTENPYWLEKAYDSAINDVDTGIMKRNQMCSKRATNLCALLNIKDENILDYAGGYGIFTRLMRDVGFNVLWKDKYCDNLLAKGFGYNGQNVKLLTAFEVFEHLESPIHALDEMFSISSNIFFSTLLIPEPTPKIEDWWYYGQRHGQHIGFYRKKTLEYLAKKYNKNLYSYNSEIHLFSEVKISKLFYMILMKFYKLFYIYTQRRVSSKIWSDYIEVGERK
ncbi:methyltransferase domain-containing protein [Acinetobacter chengduensis]|uniref:Methyltransferase domain-containing protein n=1 Tax=Acinetobacter chengduensis TaxID=2420890 RepID=A0ABX9TWV2_9GAMM|nr:class I SAM-dependent methyltransferase [Acinetobacter sp. WCHAc060007]RLL21519.1 methyltransferase domain-containing protein [Acinetobacter chengduensis]